MYFYGENGSMRPMKLTFLRSIWHYYTSFRYIFSGSSCRLFIENSHESVSLNGKKTCEKLDFTVVFLKQKRWNVSKKLEVSLLNLECPCLVQIYVCRKCVQTFPWKYQPNVILEIKKLWKFRFLGCFSKAKTDECYQRNCSSSDKFGITIRCSATYFLEAGVRVSLKAATKGSLGGKKKSENLDFTVVFLKQKRRSVSKKYRSLFAKSGMLLLGSDTCFLKVCARVSLKVATKWCLRCKKNSKFRFLGCFSEVKTGECDQKNSKFLGLIWNALACLGYMSGSECSCLFGIHIWKWVHTFSWK